MIVKIVVVAFCVFQVAFCQEDPEQVIRDFINQTNTEVNNYINPLVERYTDIGNSFGDEDRQLQEEYTTLREELENMTLQLSDGNPDVSLCLNIALEDAYRIYQDRADKLTALRSVQYNILGQIFTDLFLVNNEEKGLIIRTEQSIEICKNLVTTQEVQDCYNKILIPLAEMKNDILNRFEEIRMLGEDSLKVAEEEMQALNEENRTFVRQSAQTTSEELTDCIQQS